jgi:hypothetical protein
MIAERDYADIVKSAKCDEESARIYFVDDSFLEVWLLVQGDTLKRYAFHWERRHVDGKIFRHDNIPHARWSGVKTFPKHFHFESESKTVESEIPDDPLLAAKYFLNFAEEILGKNRNLG